MSQKGPIIDYEVLAINYGAFHRLVVTRPSHNKNPLGRLRGLGKQWVGGTTTDLYLHINPRREEQGHNLLA